MGQRVVWKWQSGDCIGKGSIETTTITTSATQVVTINYDLVDNVQKDELIQSIYLHYRDTSAVVNHAEIQYNYSLLDEVNSRVAKEIIFILWVLNRLFKND